MASQKSVGYNYDATNAAVGGPKSRLSADASLLRRAPPKRWSVAAPSWRYMKRTNVATQTVYKIYNVQVKFKVK